jgi:hypothetical protein
MNRLALAGALVLAGCSALEPYPATPRAAPPGAAGGPRVAICYNTLTTPLPEVQRQAQQECPANSRAEPADTDWHLQHCPLLLPARATFVCAAKR